MELQFNKTVIPCLQAVLRDCKSQEQTLEVRLDEGMPDIGRVISCWGQVLIRGKDWRSDGINVSGGVMTWVLYQPEDGGPEQCVECWLPFQIKWDFAENQHDGTITVVPCLRSVDARSASARKLIVRTCVNVLAEAFVPSETEVYLPGEVPEDVMLQRINRTFMLPGEAGEKAFQVEETLSLPSSVPGLDKILRYDLHTELIDRKVMSDKVIFRGAVLLHVLYWGKEGSLHAWDFEIPFSQFTQLDRDYDGDDPVRMHIAVTSAELDAAEDGTLAFRGGFTGQYVVYTKKTVDIVLDAYSNRRDIKPGYASENAPGMLEQRQDTIHAEKNAEADFERVVDTAFYLDHPRLRFEDGKTVGDLAGAFHILGYDSNGQLAGMQLCWEKESVISQEQEGNVTITAKTSGTPQSNVIGGNGDARADVLVESDVMSGNSIPMVMSLDMGEVTEPDPNRPSLILRRMRSDNLWNVAKTHGSSVESIMIVNRFEQEPEDDRVILIPVQ